jgi:hypothetical protein
MMFADVMDHPITTASRTAHFSSIACFRDGGDGDMPSSDRSTTDGHPSVMKLSYDMVAMKTSVPRGSRHTDRISHGLTGNVGQEEQGRGSYHVLLAANGK